MAKKSEFVEPRLSRRERERAERAARPPVGPLVKEPPPPDLADLKIEDVLRVLGALITFDAGRLYREDCSPVALHELDQPTRLAIQALEVDELWEKGDGDDKRVNVGVIKKIRQYDRIRAADLYAELKNWKRGQGAENKQNLLAEYMAALKG